MGQSTDRIVEWIPSSKIGRSQARRKRSADPTVTQMEIKSFSGSGRYMQEQAVEASSTCAGKASEANISGYEGMPWDVEHGHKS